METTKPRSVAEPELPAAGGSAARTTLYAALVVLLAAGGWVRFNPQIASVAPAIAAPAADAAQEAVEQSGALAGPTVLAEASLVARTAEPAAVAGMGLDQKGQAAMLSALKRDQIRLIQMPLFDAGPSAPDGPDRGRSVRVATAGYSRLVPIGRQPVVVTLPINRAGVVSMMPAAGVKPATGGLVVGAITVSGPVVLPPLAMGQRLEVGVVAE